jgi:hypothetical protein
VAEGKRTVPRWAPIYYVVGALPGLARLVAGRGTRHLLPGQVTFAAMLVLIADLVLLRDAPGSRLADVYATTAVAVAIAAGRWVPASPGGARQWRPLLAGLTAAAVLAVALVPQSGIASRAKLVAARLRDASPAIIPDPRTMPLIDYIRRCTTADDRIVVGGFGPELPVLAHRAFAAGLPDWVHGYYEHPDDIARARRQLAREHVGVAVMLDGGEAFSRSWPILAADLHARGFTRHDLKLASGNVEVWLPESSRIDQRTGLPCGA